MIQVKLNFRARFALGELFAMQQGNVKQLRIFIRAYEQVRITEEDRDFVDYKIVPGNAGELRVTWNEVKAFERNCTLTLEDEEAKVIQSAVEAHERWTMIDVRDWVERLLLELTPVKQLSAANQ